MNAYAPGMYCPNCGSKLDRRPTPEMSVTCPVCDDVHEVETTVRIVVVQPVRLQRGHTYGAIVLHEVVSSEDETKNRRFFPEGRITSSTDWRRDAQRILKQQTGIEQKVQNFNYVSFESVPGSHMILLFCEATPINQDKLPEYARDEFLPEQPHLLERLIETSGDKLFWSLQRRTFREVIQNLEARRVNTSVPPEVILKLDDKPRQPTKAPSH